LDLNKLIGLAEDLKEQIVTWRRDFHQNPETGYQEFRTSEIVATHLESLGLEVKRNVGIEGKSQDQLLD
jgi:metal-dependent amidase/aminoacylase/carboxypeptidase family protein